MKKTTTESDSQTVPKLSRFCYMFERNDALCIYHALGISPVYFSKDFLPMFNALLHEKRKRADIYALSPLKQEDTANLFSKLEAKKFIVVDDDEDGRQLHNFQTKYVGKPSVAVMYLLVTDSCNLACSYCFIKNNMPTDHRFTQMTPNCAAQAILFFSRQLALSGVQKPLVIFYGGEPLLNMPALTAAIETIEKFKNNGVLPHAIRTAIVTNGTLITPEKARFLKSHNVSVSVSIDGPEMLTASLRLQGKNMLYHEILKGFEILKNEGVELGISCTLGDASIEQFDAILEWVSAQKVTSVGFNIVRPIPPFTVSPEYPNKVADALIRGYESLSTQGIHEDRMGRKVKAFAEGKPYPYDCAGCGNQIVVTPQGKVGPCAGFLGTGKYFITDINDATFDHRTDSIYKLWSNRSPLVTKECLTCPAIAVCGGGCPYSAEINKGNLQAVDDIFCAHAKKTLEHLIWSLHARLH